MLGPLLEKNFFLIGLVGIALFTTMGIISSMKRTEKQRGEAMAKEVDKYSPEEDIGI